MMRRQRKASTGVRDSDHPWRDRAATWTMPVVLALLVPFMAWVTWDALYSRPRTYDALERRGVPARASVHYVRALSARDDYYRLTLNFRGETISVRYRDNFAQFRPRSERQYVDVLVDPEDPETVFTATDVRERTNSGFGGMAAFGAIGTIVCFFGTILWVRMVRRLGDRGWLEDMSWNPSTANVPREVIARGNMQATEAIADLVAAGRRLPLVGQLWVDDEAILAAISRMRAYEGAMNTWNSSQTPGALRGLRALIRAGRRVPVAGGVRVDREAVLQSLDELRAAVGRDLEAVAGRAG